MLTTTHDAYEICGAPGAGPYFVTCEHASNRVPAPLRTTEADRPWLDTHWGYDIGARTLSRELIRLSGSSGVLTRFSRLVVDANREPHHPDLIRLETEGHPLSFNRGLTPDAVAARIARFHEPYHRAIDEQIRAHRQSTAGDLLLLSIHSFTPIWRHQLRTMDVGVLFAEHEAVARRAEQALQRVGFETALNEPYSGREGLIYAAARHGDRHGLVFLELEVNQSLICTPARARKTARRVADALGQLQLRHRGRPSWRAPAA